MNSELKGQFKALCRKYDDVNAVCKVRRVTASVEEVKMTMAKNIQDALANSTTLENIEDQSSTQGRLHC